MALYEHIFLARQDVSQQQVEDLTAQLTEILAQGGGKVTKTEYWGLKSLSYRIRKNRKAHFRLLNLDAPEKDGPYTEAECLGDEATAFLADLLPEGIEVRLVADVEPQDQYGRDLAGVYLDDVLVNAEIARAGYAVPVLFEPNDRFHPDVVAAHEEAQEAGRGLYDPANGCTPR